MLLLLFLFISTDYTNSHLLKELEELSKDDVVEVRCTALSVLADMIPLVDQGMQRDIMIPCSTCTCTHMRAHVHVHNLLLLL